MALTLEQKMKLDNEVMNVLLDANYGLTASEIVIRLDMPVTVQSIAPSIVRIMKNHSDLRLRTSNYGTKEYSLNRVLTTLDDTIRKERSRLYFGNSANLEIYYDFATGEISSPCDIRDIHDCHDMIQTIAKRNIEWVFNYLDRVESISDLLYDLSMNSIPTTCKKGLLKALDELELPLTGKNIIKAEKFLDLGAKNFVYWDKLFSKYGETFANRCISFGYEKIMKLAYNSMKNGEFPTYYEISEFLDLYNTLASADFEVRIDTNRGIAHNSMLLRNLSEKVENELLARKLQVLNGLHGYKIDDNLEIVVPQCLEDLQNEGKMQHNCVGYYYNRAIKDGRYGIYFIRKTSNVEHSYITCRYDYHSHETVEHRFVNNRWAGIEDIISQIDKRIPEIL